jgi:outer membrane protein assembly factor BamB
MKNTLQLLTFCLLSGLATAGDQPQWGERYTRNMVSDETGLPESFDPATGLNVKWVVPLGSQTYATPIVAGGKVLVSTNNNPPRDPSNDGDRGVLLCLNEAGGSFCWQLAVPKLGPDKYLDWPKTGMSSPATVEGDRVYVMTNRVEVVCLDLNGLADGNDGPYQDEGRHAVESATEVLELTDRDADILWLFDMQAEVGMYPHDAAHASPLLHGDVLYVNTCNGVDNTHRLIRSPEAPSLIALDKNTGRLLAQDEEGIGPRIFHSTWSSPSLGEVDGKDRVFFAGGDGVCYGFDALVGTGPLNRTWKFDCDPNAPKTNVHKFTGNRGESPSNIMSMPVFHEGRLFVTGGGDIWWGKKEAWIKCLDATGTGDVTDTGEIWSRPLDRHCCSTPSVYNGLVFVADCGRKVHCFDAETGQEYWEHKTGGEIWGSTLVADGKVYVGTRRGDFWVFAAKKEKVILSTTKFEDGTIGTPTAANGVLYVATMKKLYALALPR